MAIDIYGDDMNYGDARRERRGLKQRLFTIRRFVEGEVVDLPPDLFELKARFEAKPGFTSWSDFPERWDVGDPHGVKQSAYASTDADRENIRRIQGKSLDDIVKLVRE